MSRTVGKDVAPGPESVVRFAKYVRLLLGTLGLRFVDVHRQLGLPDETRRDTTRAFAGGRRVPRPEVVDALIACCRRVVPDPALMLHYEQTVRDLYATAQRKPLGPDVDPTRIVVELGTAPPNGLPAGAQSLPNPSSRENAWAWVLGAFTTWPRRLLVFGLCVLMLTLSATVTQSIGATDTHRRVPTESTSTGVVGAPNESAPPPGTTLPSNATPSDVKPTRTNSTAPTASGGTKSPRGPGASPSMPGAPTINSCADVNDDGRLGDVRRQCAALRLNVGSKIDLDSTAANWDVTTVTVPGVTDPYDAADMQLTNGGLGVVVAPSRLMNTKYLDFTSCRNETAVVGPVALKDIAAGNAFCVHTTERRSAGFVMSRVIVTTQGTVTGIEVEVTVWARQGGD